MKTAIIGTYPPRECGIGTFTYHLYESIIGANRHNHVGIIALNNSDKLLSYPNEVEQIIRQDYQRDYIDAAKFINHSGTDICILQHEFGIFGGKDGVYILPLIHRLKIPLVVTLHTILSTPSYSEKLILQEICKKACKIVVMTQKAIDFLDDIYDVPKDKIELIEHGVPQYQLDHQKAKIALKLQNKNVMLTFGFLGRNKGIDVAIKALPKVIERHPNSLYFVLGKTHPNVLGYSGEEYLIYLRQLVRTLGLDNHVVIPHKYMGQDELFMYLHASDIYITPYNNEAQITSGTLSYAVGVGSCVISTPYWHAVELLANNRGLLFDFGNSEQLADILIHLLDHPEELNTLRRNAGNHGKEITWPITGIKYSELLAHTIQECIKEVDDNEQPFDLLMIPTFSLKHIKRLTDDTGIIQHAKYGIPNFKHGYCLDDNARALLMALMTYTQKKSKKALDLCHVYLSYIHYMQNEDGSFRNLLSFNRNYIDNVGSEDSFGRTIWALGYLMDNAPNDSYYQASHSIFFKAAPIFEELKSIRSIANTIIGISHYLNNSPDNNSMVAVLRKLANKLVDYYDDNSSADWNWFEEVLTYDNAMLPLALLHVAKVLNDEHIKDVGFASMDFLIQHTLSDGYLSLIGNDGWFNKNGRKAMFSQQPVDAMAMILMFHQAYNLTKNKEYLSKLFSSFMWFLGENDLRMRLYDFETHGCCDGLERNGINRNQGAESTLAYLISHLTVLKAHEDFYSLK